MLILPLSGFSQHDHSTKSIHSHSNSHYRVAVLIGHTLIKAEGTDQHIFIPSWGLDLEYWINHKWGIGLHNDIEIESFVVINQDNEEIERVNPLVLTLDGLWHFNNGLILTAGPGLEIANGHTYSLIRFGVEYEKDIGGGFDIAPTFFYDHRFDGFSTWSLALGVGKRF